MGIHPWYTDGLTDNWLDELETLLQQHPSALIGEIGLCKAAKNLRSHPNGKQAALLLQRNVFKKQFMLAAKLRRGVSIHYVSYYQS